MEKINVVFTIIVIVLSVKFVTIAESDVDLGDGGSYTLSDNTYQDSFVWLDRYVSNNPGTHVNLINGGTIFSLFPYNYSTIDMSGGTIELNIQARGNSEVSVSGGVIGLHLVAEDNSMINFTNGTVIGSLLSENNSNIKMLGGSVNGATVWDNASISISGGIVANGLSTNQNGTIYLQGSGFEIDGQSLSYGDKLSNFGSLVLNGRYDYFTGTITGTLSDGSNLNCDFRIFNLEDLAGTGDIIIIPEPATMALLGVGGLLIRKRKFHI